MTHFRCNVFDMISGFVLFDIDDLSSIIKFASSVTSLGNINDLVYNATFASINLSNGLAGTNFNAAKAAGNNTLRAFNRLLNPTWRSNAYQFCDNGCKGVVIVNSYDSYNTAVNGAFHQIANGSCNDATSINDAAW